MLFLVASFIVMFCASLVTIRTLITYSHFPLWINVITTLIVSISWFAPILIGWLRYEDLWQGSVYNILHNLGYTLFGFVFILFCVLLCRDIIWFATYRLGSLLHWQVEAINPMNVSLLNKANLAVIIASMLISAYAFYEGVKEPRLVELTLQSSKISRPVDIIILSDLHVDRTTSVKSLKHLVARIKGLRPDAVLIAGDLVDDKVSKMPEQIAALRQIRAPYGTYIVLGNHEFYADIRSWMPEFLTMGYRFLYNSGFNLDNYNLYIGGIPDYNTTRLASSPMSPDMEETLRASSPDSYKILLSHSPSYALTLPPETVDLIVSGHTHGGQIFPFHLLVKQVNKFLSGLYDVNGMKLFVSNGYGYWGPPMRLFAPSELVLLHLEPVSDNSKNK